MNKSEIIFVNPSLASLRQMQGKLAYAKVAERLLKKKATSLRVLQKDTACAILENCIELDSAMKNAFITLAAAKFIDGDFSSIVEENLPEEAHVRTIWHRDKHLGGSIQYESIEVGPEPCQLIGLATGGHQLSLVKIAFFNALDVLVKRVSLNNAFNATDIILSQTWRKFRVIERFTVPRIKNTISYIENDLDDQEREEMFRLLKVKKKRANKSLLCQRNDTEEALKEEENKDHTSLTIGIVNSALYQGLMTFLKYILNFVLIVATRIQNKLRNMYA